MATMTKAQAEIAADMIHGETRKLMLHLGGLGNERDEVSEEAVDDVIALGFARRDKNLIDGSDVLLLTNIGKKVVDALRTQKP